MFQRRTGLGVPHPGLPGTASITAVVLTRGRAGSRARRTLSAIALVAVLGAGATALSTPMASAASVNAGPLCEGYSLCSIAPYTTHNYQNEMNNSYWGMTPGIQCTNYVAFVESSDYGVPAPTYALGSALDWATRAQAHGVTVNQTPTVGSVAQWDPGSSAIGTDGHVAIVEAVGPNDSYIVVSQDNWSSDTDYYGWALILNGAPNQGEPWPDNFIHFPGAGLPTTLSYTQPDRLVQSTGNLYWTADQTLGDGISQATVFRASKDNVPGYEEILYRESLPASSRPVDFEAITYANVGGTWYGYFVANYLFQNESQIMQVPLAGGAAVVLATSPAFIGNRDLVTDGSFLYWADAEGIRKMAIAGGPVQTLVSGVLFAHLGLDRPVLYYSSGNSIMFVATSGGTPTAVVNAPSAITAFYPPTASDGNVYFGEANGSVNLFPGLHDSVYQLQTWGNDLNITSLSVADNYILWGECPAELAYAVPVPGLSGGPWQMPCSVVGYDNGSFLSVPTSGPPTDVQGDAGAWYWGGYQLEKYTL